MVTGISMRKVMVIIALILLLLIAAGGVGYWKITRILGDMNIEQLDVRLASIGWHQLQLKRLSFMRDGNLRQTVSLKNVRLNWRWTQWFYPQFVELVVGHAQVTVSQGNEKNPPNATSFKLPDSWRTSVFIPDMIPARIHFAEVHIELPCPAGKCLLAGAIATQKKSQTLSLNLHFSPGEELLDEHQVQLIAQYQVRDNLPYLTAKLLLDQSTNVQLQSRLKEEGSIYWAGNLDGTLGWPDAWWQDALARWGIQLAKPFTQPEDSLSQKPPHGLPQVLPQPLQISSQWHIRLQPLLNAWSSDGQVQWSKGIDGNVSLNVSVPQPIGVRNLGQFSGHVDIALEAKAGKLRSYQLDAMISVEQLLLPDAWRIEGLADAAQITLQSQASDDISFNALPLLIKADMQLKNAPTGNLTAQVVIDAVEKKITVEDAILTAQAEKIDLPENVQLKNIQLDVHTAGYLQADQFAVTSVAPGKFEADFVAPDFSLKATSIRLSSEGFNVAGNLADGAVNWSKIKLDAMASLRIDQLVLPQLKTAPWWWQGEVNGAPEDFTLSGNLNLGSRANVAHRVRRKPANFSAEWQIPEIFFLAGNPFAELTYLWPELLTLKRGKLAAEGKLFFDLNTNRLMESTTRIQLTDVAGIYDTAAFNGLTTNVTVTTDEKNIKIASGAVTLKEINKGFIVGPLKAAASYQTVLEQLTHGTLSLNQFSAEVMGGKVTTAAQTFDFRQAQQHLLLTVEGIELAALLQQYPSSELSGTGRISGHIPVAFTSGGVTIEQGNLSAEAPGGRLQFQSRGTTALASSQPGMKLITDALQDFHYSVLTGNVNYDADGRLLLSLKLQGNNPEVENGRPINFSINLEEDLPELITSIQLSSQISESIKKRLQERIQQGATQR